MRLPSLLFYEESRFPPSLPWPSSPTETPAAIPAGVSPCQPCQQSNDGECYLSRLHFVWFIGAAATRPPLLRFTDQAGTALGR